MGLFQLKWTKYGFWGALPKVIRKLIEKKLDAFTLRMLQWAYRSANFNFKDTKSTPWFMEACAAGYARFIETTTLNIDIWEPAFTASCANGHDECVDLLLKWKTPSDHHMTIACGAAAQNGHVTIVAKFPRDAQKQSLAGAIQSHQIRVVDFILDGSSLSIAFRDTCIRFNALELFQKYFLDFGPLGFEAPYYFCPEVDNTRTLQWLFEHKFLDLSNSISVCMRWCHPNTAAWLFNYFGSIIDSDIVLRKALQESNFALATWLMDVKRPASADDHVYYVLSHFSGGIARAYGIMNWAHKRGLGLENTRYTTALCRIGYLNVLQHAICTLHYPWDRRECCRVENIYHPTIGSLLHREADCPNNYVDVNRRACFLTPKQHAEISNK